MYVLGTFQNKKKEAFGQAAKECDCTAAVPSRPPRQRERASPYTYRFPQPLPYVSEKKTGREKRLVFEIRKLNKIAK